MCELVKVCIFCMTDNRHLKKLLDTDSDNMKIVDKLEFCFGSVVYDDSHCMICMKCWQELQRIFEFKKMFVKNQSLLKRYFIYVRDSMQCFTNKPRVRQQNKDDTKSHKKGRTKNMTAPKLSDSCRSGSSQTEQIILDDIKEELPELVEGVTENRTEASENRIDVKEELEQNGDPQNPGTEIGELRNCENENGAEAQISEKINAGRTNEKSVEHEKMEEERTRDTDVTGYIKERATHKCVACSKITLLKKYIRQLEKEIKGREKGKLVDSDKKEYICYKCHKSFSRRFCLNRHLNIHKGKRPYICNKCQKHFSQNSHLKQHMMLHTGARPFKCGQCKKKFPQKCHLKQHMTVHGAVKPYRCRLCQKQFTRNTTLKKHMVVMHRMVKS